MSDSVGSLEELANLKMRSLLSVQECEGQKDADGKQKKPWTLWRIIKITLRRWIIVCALWIGLGSVASSVFAQEFPGIEWNSANNIQDAARYGAQVYTQEGVESAKQAVLNCQAANSSVKVYNEATERCAAMTMGALGALAASIQMGQDIPHPFFNSQQMQARNPLFWEFTIKTFGYGAFIQEHAMQGIVSSAF